ncbi:DoxX [Strigomonas culicis]|uniref:DoxX n=1 Tax=Strigomonas culicis TaxID=28005 RepID=S9UM52_9TRYP|nr:DoxX [Strigomonas culicis]EPY31922.1 DoxX [Strigomonas culicis]EPY37058.1 DoxX [Strigomonas culicis]|eukprot:EPY28542.1 DoxX [Strigomonas culicis]
MFFKNLIRYLGLILILIPYIGSGLQKITNPAVGAALLAKSNFPKMLALGDIHLGMSEYIYLIQATGVIFLTFSLFILLAVGRSFFCFLMAIGTLIITVAFHMNWENPLETSEQDLIHVSKNLALTGAFLFVCGSGHRSRKYSRAHAEVEKQQSSKKSN